MADESQAQDAAPTLEGIAADLIAEFPDVRFAFTQTITRSKPCTLAEPEFQTEVAVTLAAYTDAGSLSLKAASLDELPARLEKLRVALTA